MAVLITRPAKDSLDLQEFFVKNQIKSFVFPTIEVKKLTPKLEKKYDVVIFISKNAVDYAQDFLPFLQNCLILAVGEKTANTLKNYGLTVDFYPKTQPSSLSLLKIPAVKAIKGQNILIVRGLGGVETLKNTLTKQQNKVDYLEVYTRIKNSNISQYQLNLDNFLLENNRQILITSCDILDYLIELTNKIDKKITLIVVSKRIKYYAQKLGFSSIIITDDIDNNSILRAIKNG